MNDNYLIPANSKKSMLIFGLFETFDLILFGGGIFATTILLLALPLEHIFVALFALSPALISSFLVFPIPNYHNIRTILQSIFSFYTQRQKFIWKGWCFSDGNEENKEQIYKR